MKWFEAVFLAFCLLPFCSALGDDDLPILVMDENMCPDIAWVADGDSFRFMRRVNPFTPSMMYVKEVNQWAYIYTHTFQKGQTLYVRSPDWSYECEINLMAGTPVIVEDKGVTALHVKQTFVAGGNKIVANACVRGKWLQQVTVDSSLRPEQESEISIYAADEKFVVRINGVKMIEYPYRVSLDYINYVNAMGTIHLYQMYVGGRTTFNMPYTGHIPKEFANNDVIIFRGVPGEGGFTINVYSARDDIVLQFNVTSLSQQQCIELNSQFNGKWAEPQRIDGCPFAVGKEFKIYIQNNSNRVNYFTTYVDTKLISTYNASTKAVMNARLEVTGDVSPRDLTICVMMSPRDTNTLVLS
uniref:Galectin n=1 Tax=Panagrellus redivivus TaxID=6233 RepID=A0A7E4V5C6_PANRE